MSGKICSELQSYQKKIYSKRPQIIRFVHYNQFKDLENWSREQLLLYISFIDVEEFQKINRNTLKAAYDEQVGNVLEKKESLIFKSKQQIIMTNG